MVLSIFHGIVSILRSPKLLFSSNAVDYYQYLGDDVVEGRDGGFVDPNKPLWLNLGYWKSARTYPDAAKDMARLLGDAAELGPKDELLDVGFGFAEQDFFFIEHFDVKKITGLNITPLHVERANQRVRERKLESRMDLRIGSATEMPFPENSFDKVTALESAFHFNTREKFFSEAFRVLRPGGRLATADGGPVPGQGPLTFSNRFVMKRWSVPVENMYDRDEYCRKLEAHGFVNVKAQTIRNDVFPGCTKYRRLREQGIAMKDAVIELSQREIDECYSIEDWALTGFTDYVIFTADKPR
ncbi:MAG TPA: methyltransferase domain-containing protein [Polyangiaceae bacterium]|nr:methyltransferase domain-containing protein [Polyangiaceae bacterium]